MADRTGLHSSFPKYFIDFTTICKSLSNGSLGFTVEGPQILGYHDTPKSGSSPRLFPENLPNALAREPVG